MAHFSLKNTIPRQVKMVLDTSLNRVSHTHPRSALDPSPDIHKLIEHYIISCKVESKSPLTIGHYAQVLKQFMAFVRSQSYPADIKECTTHHIRLFILSLQERGLMASSVNKYFRALQTFFNWLVSEGLIDTNPVNNIKPPRVPRQVVKPYTEQDIHNMLLLCSDNTFLAVRNRAMVLVYLDTGLRLSELSAIQKEDIDFHREVIKVMGKGAKERVVRIGKASQKALLRYLLLRTDKLPCLWHWWSCTSS